MNKKDTKKAVINGGRSSGRALKLLCELHETFRQVCELHEKQIAALEHKVEKLKADLDNARESANRQEQWEIYSVLNDIYNDNFEVITSVSN